MYGGVGVYTKGVNVQMYTSVFGVDKSVEMYKVKLHYTIHFFSIVKCLFLLLIMIEVE